MKKIAVILLLPFLSACGADVVMLYLLAKEEGMTKPKYSASKNNEFEEMMQRKKAAVTNAKDVQESVIEWERDVNKQINSLNGKSAGSLSISSEDITFTPVEAQFFADTPKVSLPAEDRKALEEEVKKKNVSLMSRAANNKNAAKEVTLVLEEKAEDVKAALDASADRKTARAKLKEIDKAYDALVDDILKSYKK